MKNNRKSVYIATAFAVFAMAFFCPKTSKATEDNSPPQLTAFSMTPSGINTDSADQTLTLNVTLTDNISGVCIGGDCGSYNSSPTQLRLHPLSGGTQLVDFTNFARTSGDALNGTYTATATVPKGAANGIWEVNNFLLVDKLGNNTSLSKADLENAYGAGTAEINNTASTSDNNAPHVTAFSMTPSQVDASSGDQTLNLQVTLTDDIAGICLGNDCGSYYHSSPTQLRLHPVSGGSQLVDFTSFTRTSGNDLNGTYTATATMPQGSASGVWEVSNFLLVDKLGNNTNLSKANLESTFGAGSAEINNISSVNDTSPPQLTAFSMTPSEINTAGGDQTLTLNVTLTDNSAGVCIGNDCGTYNSSPTQMRLQPLIGTQSVDFYNFTRTSGDALNGTYTATATLPKNSKEGVWEVSNFLLVDKLGNHTTLSKANLENTFGTGATIANTAENTSVHIDREWSLFSSNVSAVFPADTVVTKREGGSFAFYQMVNQDFSIGNVTTDGLDSTDISNIAGKIKIGIPGLNLSFSKAVTLEFNVGSQYNGQTLEIQTLEENGGSWANETTCTVSSGKCSFTVNHASYFAAIKTTASSTSNGTVTGGTNGNIVVGTDTPTLNYSVSKKAKKKINLTFNGLSLTKKKWVKVRLNGRKVTVQRVRRSGNDSIVRIYFKYRKWAVGNYNLSMTYKNQIKVPYTTKKGKTKYRKGWENGGVNSENILSII